MDKQKKANKHITIALENPKFPRNVGEAIRACAAFEIPYLVWSGDRVLHPDEKGQIKVAWGNNKQVSEKYRFPREERMSYAKDVVIIREADLLGRLTACTKPIVCVEFDINNPQELWNFKHPEDALYVFGPEDGSVSQKVRKKCHHFVKIPTRECLNLSQAVCTILAHRAWQTHLVESLKAMSIT